MSKTELRKRDLHSVNTRDMDSPTDQHRAQGRTVSWQEIPEWQRDNRYVLGGYRPEKADYKAIFASLTFLHNETCNVYTHLIGAVLLPCIATPIILVLSEPRFFGVSAIDFTMFGFYFWCAEFCLLASAFYHLLGPHSIAVEQFWHQMDLLGIVVNVLGTFVSGIYYLFYCTTAIRYIHWAITLSSASTTAAFICIPKFRTLRWRTGRICAYIALGLSAFIPLLHGVSLFGVEYMLKYAGMKWYLLELALYGGGALLYGTRIPERFAPGKFDIWGSSHQIFHVAILVAIYMQTLALRQAFVTCHTLDVCKLQATYRNS